MIAVVLVIAVFAIIAAGCIPLLDPDGPLHRHN